ncbi:hypothetical protein RQP46_001655 [Phenoliferia psychrophenolica]
MAPHEDDHIDGSDSEPPKKRSKKSSKKVDEEEEAPASLPEPPTPSAEAAPTPEAGDEPARVEVPTRRAADLLKLKIKKRDDKKEVDKRKKLEKRARDIESGVVEKEKRVRKKPAAEKISYESVLESNKAWRKAFAKALRKRSEGDDAESEAVTFLNLACPAGLPGGMPGTGPDAVVQAMLVRADLVGCKLTVKESKTNPSLLTKGGIVVQETLGTFKIVTEQSVVRFLPKKDTVFSFTIRLDPTTGKLSRDEAVEETTFVLYGDAFAFRSSDGTAVKWKQGSGTKGDEQIAIKKRPKKAPKAKEVAEPVKEVEAATVAAEEDDDSE